MTDTFPESFNGLLFRLSL